MKGTLIFAVLLLICTLSVAFVRAEYSAEEPQAEPDRYSQQSCVSVVSLIKIDGCEINCTTLADPTDIICDAIVQSSLCPKVVGFLKRGMTPIQICGPNYFDYCYNTSAQLTTTTSASTATSTTRTPTSRASSSDDASDTTAAAASVVTTNMQASTTSGESSSSHNGGSTIGSTGNFIGSIQPSSSDSQSITSEGPDTAAGPHTISSSSSPHQSSSSEHSTEGSESSYSSLSDTGSDTRPQDASASDDTSFSSSIGSLSSGPPPTTKSSHSSSASSSTTRRPSTHINEQLAEVLRRWRR